MMFTKPLETSDAEYQDLIDGGEAWYRLLRLFKMKSFPQGLDIVIRTTEEMADMRALTSLPPLRLPGSGIRGIASPQTSSQARSIATGGPSRQDDVAHVHISTALPDEEPHLSEIEKNGITGASGGHQSSPGTDTDAASSNNQDKNARSPIEEMPPGSSNAVTPRRKRKRAQAGEESAEEDGGYRPSPSELRGLMEGVPSGEPAEYGHRGLNASMKRLENKARNLEREQARAMSELIEALLEVPPSKVFMNVAERLKNQIPVGALLAYWGEGANLLNETAINQEGFEAGQYG
jgi:hypothetical protein